ncbi:MAG: hypothetical protein ABFC24_06375 [Methanoregulaceae archaeon]
MQQNIGRNTTPDGTGIASVVRNSAVSPINLSEANDGFREWAGIRFSPSEDEDRTLPGNISLATLPDNVSSTLQIHSVRGIGLLPDSSARIWLFGIRAGNASFLAEYQAGTWSLRELPGNLPGEPLNISAAIQPSALFMKNVDIAREIFSTNNSMADVSLEGTTYTITSRAEDAYRTWIFDAESGTVISRP